MAKRMLMVSVAMLMAVTMGCTTVQKWAAGGAVVGGTVGGIWAANAGGLNALEGTAVGAATGATVGALVGDKVQKNTEWKSLSEAKEKLAAENATLQENNRSLQTKLQATQNDLDTANRRLASQDNDLKNLRDELAKCKGSRMELSMPTDLLFESGSSRLSVAGKKALTEAAAKIKETYGDKFITVEGHTDVNPIKYSHWKDNWDLGSARSLAVLRFLISKGVEPAKCSAATYSQYQPVAQGDSKEAKAKNRRAVIVIHTGWPRF